MGIKKHVCMFLFSTQVLCLVISMFVTSWACFVEFWSQSQKTPKSSLLGMVLSSSRTNAKKSQNQTPRDWLRRLLEPVPKKHQITFPWTCFVEFMSPAQQMFKPRVLGLFLSTCGAKARKSSNRTENHGNA